MRNDLREAACGKASRGPKTELVSIQDLRGAAALGLEVQHARACRRSRGPGLGLGGTCVVSLYGRAA